MAKNARRSRFAGKESRRLLGTFSLSGGPAAVGELRLAGASTNLRLHSDKFLHRVEDGSSLIGTTYDGDHVTLIGCMSPGSGHSSRKDGSIRYHADVFPHYVAVGDRHLNPAEECITGIHFTTTDLKTLFYDFDAFSHVIDARPIIDTLLEETRRHRPVEKGEWPQVYYFTGKDRIVEVGTVVGKISVNHRPRASMGGPSGFYMKNRIAVSIEPYSPLTFDAAIDRMYEVCGFLSFAAGRAQGIERIDVCTNEVTDGIPQMMRIHQSHRQKAKDVEHHRPHPGDVPLNPIGRRAEFDTVLADWLRRHSDWRLARGQYLRCLRNGNRYGVERLVAAANMFDILPTSAFPASLPLDADLASTRDACARLLRRHPVSPDRNSVLSALGRLGQLSLPKKVAHRVSVVEEGVGARFVDLQFVTNTAVKCRNYFVHGSAGDLDFSRIEPLVPFLTDALEFTFAASDLIEAGWDARRLASDAMGWGHSFARFRSSYDKSLSELRRATTKAV